MADQILFHARQRPRLADGRAALRNDAGQRHVAADRDGHAAVLKNFAVEINLRELFGESAAGKAAINRQPANNFYSTNAASFPRRDETGQ